MNHLKKIITRFAVLRDPTNQNNVFTFKKTQDYDCSLNLNHTASNMWIVNFKSETTYFTLFQK